jgi:hypothetical protein
MRYKLTTLEQGGGLLDTVTIKFPITLEEGELYRLWGYNCRSGSDEICSWTYTTTYRECSIRSTYYPHNYKGEPQLVINFSSLPKMVYGNNYTMLPYTDMDLAASEAQKALANVPGIPWLDVCTGILHRVDLCYNHQVGDHVDTYIQGISQLSYPRMDRVGYSNSSSRNRDGRNNGVVFRNRGRELKFYNKYRQEQVPSAYGLLRQESSISGTDQITRALGIQNPTLLDIKSEAAEKVLNEDLMVLGLDTCCIVNHDAGVKRLMEIYPASKALKLDRYIQLKVDNPLFCKKEIARILSVDPRTINRWEEEIRKSGIIPAYTESGEMQPPLYARL